MTSLVKKFIKLHNGDVLICCMDKIDNLFDTKSITIIDPVFILSIRIPRMGMIIESYVLKPWIPFSKDNIVDLITSSILAVSDPEDKIIEQYEKFLDDEKKRSNENQLVDDSSDDDMSNDLEKIMSMITNNREENEEDENDNPTRVLH
jgi:hypothetical protein